jgi:hypothetical protein
MTEEHVVAPRSGADLSLCLFFAGLARTLVHYLEEGIEERCSEYLSLVHSLSLISPGSLTFVFKYIAAALSLVQAAKSAMLVMEVLLNLIAYQHALKDELTEDQIQQIMGMDVSSARGVWFLRLFPEQAQGSVLAGAIVKFYFEHELDPDADVFIQLLADGLVPPEVPIPEEPDHVNKLRFVVALWDVWPSRRSELAQYMLRTMDRTKPLGLYLCARSVEQSRSLLADFCPQELGQVLPAR